MRPYNLLKYLEIRTPNLVIGTLRREEEPMIADLAAGEVHPVPLHEREHYTRPPDHLPPDERRREAVNYHHKKWQELREQLTNEHQALTYFVPLVVFKDGVVRPPPLSSVPGWDASRDLFARSKSDWLWRERYLWQLQASLIGEVGFAIHEKVTSDGIRRTGELGYWFARHAQRRGFATEAAAAVIHVAFNQFGVERFMIGAGAANLPGIRVIEKLGARDATEEELRNYQAQDVRAQPFKERFFVLDREPGVNPSTIQCRRGQDEGPCEHEMSQHVAVVGLDTSDAARVLRSPWRFRVALGDAFTRPSRSGPTAKPW